MPLNVPNKELYSTVAQKFGMSQDCMSIVMGEITLQKEGYTALQDSKELLIYSQQQISPDATMLAKRLNTDNIESNSNEDPFPKQYIKLIGVQDKPVIVITNYASLKDVKEMFVFPEQLINVVQDQQRFQSLSKYFDWSRYS